MCKDCGTETEPNGVCEICGFLVCEDCKKDHDEITFKKEYEKLEQGPKAQTILDDENTNLTEKEKKALRDLENIEK